MKILIGLAKPGKNVVGILNIHKNQEYEVLTPEGFKDFTGVSVSYDKEVIKLNTTNTSIRVTKNHRFLLDKIWVEAENIKIGEIFSNGDILVDSIDVESEPVYDLLNVEKTSSYITQGLVSHNCSLIYVDEQSFVQNWSDFAQSVLPTISSGKKTKLIFTSTPNGYNHFYKYCTEAKKKTNGFTYFEVPWYMVPGRDEKWKAKVLQDLNNDEEKFNQEYSCQFLGSIMTLIASHKLKAMTYDMPWSENEKLKIYIRDVPKNGSYVLFADVAQGKGLDYSAFSIIDITQQPYRQVAAFKNNKISPIEYAEIIYRAAKKFNDAYVLIELNDIGGQVANTLITDLEYEQIIYSENRGRGGQVPCLFRDKAEPGVRTSVSTKAIGCSMLKSLIERDLLVIVDSDTIEELSTFVRSDKAKETWCASEGKHDDLVMPLVQFGWLTNSILFTELTNSEIRNQLREKSSEEIEAMCSPVVMVSGGFNENNMVQFGGDVWLSVGGDNSEYSDEQSAYRESWPF